MGDATRFILSLVGVLALLFGVMAIAIAPSDIQLGIGANAILSAFVLFGLVSVPGRIAPPG